MCRKCLDEQNRELAVAHAENWLQAIFAAAPAAQRVKLYKVLAAIYHPGVGGDPAVMVALNAVREAFAKIAPR